MSSHGVPAMTAQWMVGDHSGERSAFQRSTTRNALCCAARSASRTASSPMRCSRSSAALTVFRVGCCSGGHDCATDQPLRATQTERKRAAGLEATPGLPVRETARRADAAAAAILQRTRPQYLSNPTRVAPAQTSPMGQELTSTGVPTGIERQKRLVRYCRGYLRPSACVVPLNWP